MKKVFALMIVAASAMTFTACGPSEEEEKKLQDSISKEMENTGDSLIEMMNQMNKAFDDSVAKADSTAKADSAKAKEKK
ncbi:MAG: hypothetical protein Fur0041_00400 [Bacteroidia bacterium]